MATHAAFLRGINVSGHRVTGGTLCECLEAIGLDDIATFRASGNVIFSGSGGARALETAISEALETELGYAVPAFIRTGAQLREIAAREPFSPAQMRVSKGKPQVLLLGKKPAKKAREEALALASEQDPLAIEGSELHWLPSGGTQQSELDLGRIERLLGQGTMRTEGTIEQIASKYFGG
jgi:uncharacterized protein (DUF1697 family)